MLKHHLIVAARNARRAPLATAVNVLTLAIGLACFLFAYAFVGFLDRAERHFPDADRTYVLTHSFAFLNGSFAVSGSTRTPELAAEALEAEFPDVEVTRAFVLGSSTSVASGASTARFAAVGVDPNFLAVFPLPFTAGEARSALSAPRSAVLTRAAAERLFGLRPALGQPLTIANGVDATVTGVLDAVPEPSHLGKSASAPLKFDLLVSADVREAIRAAQIDPEIARSRTWNWGDGDTTTYLVLPPTRSARELESRLPEFVQRRVPEEARAQMTVTFGLLPVRDLLRRSVDDELFSKDFGASVSTVLLALGVLVLAVACLNYANLATARAARRVREVGVRKALGAAPLQIALQHFAEAAVLTAIAMLAAFAVFRAGLPVLESTSGMTLGAVLFDGPEIWAFLMALAVGAALAAGAYPAFVLSRVEPIAALRASLARLGAKRLVAWLVGTQFAAASLLVIAVTITWLQNSQLVRSGLGAAADPLVLIDNESRMTRVDPRTLRARLAQLLQVTGVSEAGELPFQRLVGITFVGRSPDAASAKSRVLLQPVGLDFFSVLGIDVLAGRGFRDDDAAARGPFLDMSGRVVVDRAFVERFGLGSPAEAVGRLVYLPGGGGPNAGAALEIVGVVDDRHLTLRSAGTGGTMYGFGTDLDVTYVRIAADDVAAALAGVDEVWKELAPNVAISRRFFDEAFGRAYETFAQLNRVFAALSLMALAISTAGLVGIATLVVARRRREIGVRKTFGATTGQMAAMLLEAFGRPVVLANVVVWPLAYFAAHVYLRAFADPIPLGPTPFLLALGVTLGVAWLAVGTQTVRAARLKPADVLRTE